MSSRRTGPISARATTSRIARSGWPGTPPWRPSRALIGRGAIAVGAAPVEITLEVGAGILPVRIEPRAGAGPLITMTQRAPEFGTMHAPAEIAEIYGLNADDVVAVPQTVSTGTPFCVAVLRDHGVLRRARLDPGLLAAFRRRDGHPDAMLMEPFLVTLEGATPAGDTFSRLMLASPNPPEDPFTGAATGCMAAYLWAHGLIERPVFTAEQGALDGPPWIGTGRGARPPRPDRGGARRRIGRYRDSGESWSYETMIAELGHFALGHGLRGFAVPDERAAGRCRSGLV